MVAEEFTSLPCQQILITGKAMSEDEPSSDIAVLTAQMASGDETAYRRFYEFYFNRLLRYLLVLTGGREEVAREALQLTLIRVVRHIKIFHSEEVFWSWLTVLARSSVVDEQRKRKRYLAFLDRFFLWEQLDTAAVDQNADTHLLALLERNLTGLSADERGLIERKYFASESVKDIADGLQTTEVAIESRLVRIRRKLKELILGELKDEKPIRS